MAIRPGLTHLRLSAEIMSNSNYSRPLVRPCAGMSRRMKLVLNYVRHHPECTTKQVNDVPENLIRGGTGEAYDVLRRLQRRGLIASYQDCSRHGNVRVWLPI